jgi:hypothetical protein
VSRDVIAVARFSGGPGREREAAESWAFELKYYFMRRVGEQPQVAYEDGIYTVTGLMTTSHPFDKDVTEFSPVFDLGNGGPERRKALIAMYDGPRWG